MSRTRASAKAAGSRFEQQVVTYLARELHDDRIERRHLSGANDRGDVTGLRHMGARLVIECKDYGGQIKAGPWTDEAAIEAGNDDAIAGIVVAKRRGTTTSGDQWVLMTLADLVALLTGTRPQEES